MRDKSLYHLFRQSPATLLCVLRHSSVDLLFQIHINFGYAKMVNLTFWGRHLLEHVYTHTHTQTHTHTHTHRVILVIKKAHMYIYTGGQTWSSSGIIRTLHSCCQNGEFNVLRKASAWACVHTHTHTHTQSYISD